MKLEIKLSEESIDLIRKENKQFTESKRIITKVGDGCVIRFLPLKDTYDLNSEGTLGLINSLFCEVKIYDLKKKKFYISKLFHDSIKTEGGIEMISNPYKDLSTLYCFEEPVEIIYETTIIVSPLR